MLPCPCFHAPAFMQARLASLAADEARHAWQHYIPHRKSDLVASASGAGEAEVVPRAERRVSFTFRQACGGAGSWVGLGV